MLSITGMISRLSQMWLPGRHAVDAHGQELVADLAGDAEAAGGVLDVGDAVVDVVQREERRQRLLHDGAPGAAHHVADDEDVQSRPTPSASATRLMY